MDSWNVYPQNTPGTPSSTWLCPQNSNNTQGSDWLHSQNHSTERERNNNTGLATPTRFIMEYNDLNQNSSSNSYFAPYAQEMDRLFEHNFLKLGVNQEDLLNSGMYNNEDFSSFFNSNNSNETIVPVTNANNSTSTPNLPNDINSPTPSLVTDDDQDQLYNLQDEQLVRYPISAYISDDNQVQHRFPTTTSAEASQKNKQKKILTSPTSPIVDENNLRKTQREFKSSTSPISPVIAHENHKLVQQRSQRDQHQTNYPITTSSSLYQSSPVSALVAGNKQELYIQDVQQQLFTSTLSVNDAMLSATTQNLDNRDRYLQTKKHDPKQLLLPLNIGKTSMDATMSVAITSPSSSLDTDEELDQFDQPQQRKIRSHRQNSFEDFQLSITTNDLPIQQPSPVSSEFSSNSKTPPSSHETTPKEKKRRASQRKSNNKRTVKFNEGTLISPVDESHLDLQEENLMTATSSGQSLTAIVTTAYTESSEPTSTVSTTNFDASNLLSSDDSATSTSSCIGVKRNTLDDGHDETPEEKRARLLERNRIAAAKCRQKKKQAQESLQQQATDLTQKNTGLHSLVNDLREEALRLKNQLLAHSTCNCNVIQEYVRTSGHFAFARSSYTK